MLCREFRNNNDLSNKFRRIVMGLFDVEKQSWISKQPQTVPWSRMNPDSCYATFHGINATPEISLLRDPRSNEFVVLLFHAMSSEYLHQESTSTKRGYSMVSGFLFDGNSLDPHPSYPERIGLHKRDNEMVFGERVFFDNGIWYMN